MERQEDKKTISEDYIVPAIIGRLGNNLFIIAHAYAKCREFDKTLLLVRNQVIYDGNDYSKTIFRKFEFINEHSDKSNCHIYRGYFQSEKYFDLYKEEVKQLFGAPSDFIQKVKITFPEIGTKKTTVINVRRGDYLNLPTWHPTITKEYIYKALEEIKGTEHYIIASDDIPWCKENLNLSPCTYIENYPPEEQLWILSMCDNFVLSNSSFSWWAAYLSNNKGTVVAPKTWFGPSGPQNWDDIYCKEWIVLPTYFENGLIYPE